MRRGQDRRLQGRWRGRCAEDLGRGLPRQARLGSPPISVAGQAAHRWTAASLVSRGAATRGEPQGFAGSRQNVAQAMQHPSVSCDHQYRERQRRSLRPAPPHRRHRHRPKRHDLRAEAVLASPAAGLQLARHVAHTGKHQTGSRRCREAGPRCPIRWRGDGPARRSAQGGVHGRRPRTIPATADPASSHLHYRQLT